MISQNVVYKTAPFVLFVRGLLRTHVYNEKRLGEQIVVGQYTVERSLQRMGVQGRTLICGDFNAHHHWWNSESAAGSDVLVPWLERNSFELVNTPDVPTFYRPNLTRASIMDLTFATMDMREEVRDWEAPWELQGGSDHVLISFGISTRFTELVENPLHTGPYNFKQADWPQFRNLLKRFATPVLALYYSKDKWTNEETDLLALELQRCIQPLMRQSIRSKPWWNAELDHLKSVQASVLRRVRNGHASEEAYQEAKRDYHKALNRAKKRCWDHFLANARNEEVFRAYGYSKQR